MLPVLCSTVWYSMSEASGANHTLDIKIKGLVDDDNIRTLVHA